MQFYIIFMKYFYLNSNYLYYNYLLLKQQSKKLYIMIISDYINLLGNIFGSLSTAPEGANSILNCRDLTVVMSEYPTYLMNSNNIFHTMERVV